MAFTWRLVDAEGAHVRTTEEFPTRAEAEAWLGDNWRSLIDEGAEAVTLIEEDEAVYDMGLREA